MTKKKKPKRPIEATCPMLCDCGASGQCAEGAGCSHRHCPAEKQQSQERLSVPCQEQRSEARGHKVMLHPFTYLQPLAVTGQEPVLGWIRKALQQQRCYGAPRAAGSSGDTGGAGCSTRQEGSFLPCLGPVTPNLP